MAQTVRRAYGEDAVFGSLAYDFNNPRLYPDYAPPIPEYAPPVPEYAPPAPAERPAARPVGDEATRERVSSAARSRQSIAPGALLGYACAIVLLIFALMARIQLTGLAAEAVDMESQLTELQEENDRLRISFESAFNLAEIEDYATQVLEMQKPTVDQVYYINGATTDKAVILSVADSYGFTDRLSDFFSGLREYFT